MSQQWWDKASIDLEGAKKKVAEAATVSESDADLDADPGREEESSGASGSSGAE